MEQDGLDRLCSLLGGMAGNSSTLPFDRKRELTGRRLREAQRRRLGGPTPRGGTPGRRRARAGRGAGGWVR